MDLYRLTIADSQDSMQFDLLDAPIKIEDVEGAVDNTVLTGDIFTDYLFLKKRWEQKWAIMCKDEYERLRGFYTRQWSLATVPSVKVTQGYLENASWEGQVFYINTPYGGEVSSLTKMTGDTYQPTLSGKNLFNYHINTSPTTRNGLTITEEGDGAIVVSGVPTQNYVVISGGGNRTDITSILEDNTTYTLSKYDTNRYTFIEVRGTKVGGGFSYWGANTTASNTFTTDFANYTAYDIAILSSTTSVWGASSRTVRHKFQLEKGNQPTPFEQYVGGQPSPNPIGNQPIRTVTGEQTITINGQDFPINLGKNLFDKDNFSELQSYVQTNGALTTNSTAVRTLYIPCQPNTTYTVSKRTDGDQPRFCVFDTEDEPTGGVYVLHSVGQRSVAYTSPHLTITTMDRAHWLGVFYYHTSETTLTQQEILDSIQIEEGDTPTTYTAYKTPIELNDLGNGYQDEIAFDGSEWKLRKKTASYTFDGTEPWTWDDSRIPRIYLTSGQIATLGIYPAVPATTSILPIGKMNESIAKTFADFYTNSQGNGFAMSTSGNNIQVGNNAWANSAEARAAVAGTKWLYGLATGYATETTITDATLISQLNAIQAALQEGQNTVSVTSNGSNLPAKTITLNGIAGREKPVLAQTNVRIGLSDGGVLNACECRQNVTLSMRETA